MANVNKVILVGRLTRDPEARSFSWGKVTSFGFAVNNRKKGANGEWSEEPCFLDVKCFDRENGRKLATQVEEYLGKGSPVYLEGKLSMEQWEDKNGGGKRSKLVIIAEDVQFIGPKEKAAPPAPETVASGYFPGPDESPF